MAPGVTLGAKMVVSEHVFGVAMFGLLLAMLGFLLLLGVFTRPYWGTARQQHAEAPRDADDWIYVDVPPPPPHSSGDDEHDVPQPPSAEETEHNAPPTREPAEEGHAVTDSGVGSKRCPPATVLPRPAGLHAGLYAPMQKRR